jgi:putative intracellular protease/amidase
LNDAVNREFVNDIPYQQKISNTLRPEEVDASLYVAIFFAGGHGTMWDFADDVVLTGLAGKVYDNGGVVAAVCHGPAALVNVRLFNGKFLVEGKRVSAFTNEEERAVKLDQVVPFLLEDKLAERGANIQKSGLWQENVSVDGRLITGQNPSSAKKVGEEMLKVLKSTDLTTLGTQGPALDVMGVN